MMIKAHALLSVVLFGTGHTRTGGGQLIRVCNILRVRYHLNLACCAAKSHDMEECWIVSLLSVGYHAKSYLCTPVYKHRASTAVRAYIMLPVMLPSDCVLLPDISRFRHIAKLRVKRTDFTTCHVFA